MARLKTERVRILGNWIPVFYAEAHTDADLQGNRGVMCYPVDGRPPFIKIDSRLDLSEQREALWHEIGHAIETEISGTGQREVSEKVHGRLTRCQIAIMRDNPEVIRELIEEDKA
jgi:hypothetical protein